MTVTVIVAEWVALPPTAAAVAVTLDVPSGTLGPAGVGLELEPQPATPRKNRAITSMCIHRGRSQREIPIMEFLLRLAIEISGRGRNGINRARTGLCSEPGGTVSDATVAAVFTLNCTA
jgi:hypothetical protein